jgi:hypothetical protein
MSLTEFKRMKAVAVRMYLYSVPEKRFERVRTDWSGIFGRLFPQAAAA